MKSIRTKIMLCMTMTVTLSLLAVGVTGIVLNYSSTNALLEQNMTEMARVSAQRVEHELEAYGNVAFDTGCVAQLANPVTSITDKKVLMEQRAKTHGFVGYNLLDINGISIFDGKDYRDREYVQEALAGRTHISEPLLSKVTGELSIMVAAPLWEGGIPDSKVMGVVYFKPTETFLNDIVSDLHISTNGSAYMTDAEGTTIAHVNIDNVKNRDNIIENAKTNSELEPLAAISQKMLAGENGFGRYSYGGVNKFLAYAPVSGTDGWSLAINAPVSDFMDTTIQSIIISIILLVIAAGIAVALAVRLALGISRPISQCCDRLELLAQGDLNSPVPQIPNQDETGRLAKSTDTIVTTLRGIIGDLSWGLDELADGNFTVSSRAKNLYVGNFAKLLESMKDIITRLSDTLSKVHTAANQVSAGSDQVSTGAQALSQGTTEQASSVEELAATVNEISTQIKINAQSAKQASELAENAGVKMIESNQKMRNMINAMGEINDKSGQIGKIIKTIEDIAFQTNILALNAAVEAARAGAAGKGFAVVADEVRNLASKSSEASKSTAVLIEGSIKAVENGTRIADETAQTMLESVESSQNVTKNIDKISDASKEQASAIAQVTQGISQISSVIQTSSATAEESAATSLELSGQAQILKDLVEQFQLKDTEFT